MFILLKDNAEVQQSQKIFQERLQQLLQNQGQYILGFPGGSFELPVYANQSLWYAYKEIKEGSSPRHWNAFGIGETLRQKTPNSIVVEINIPTNGANGRVAGLVAKNRSDQVFILHRGKIGGNSTPLREAFQQFYPQDKWTEVQESTHITKKAILVTSLQSTSFIEDILFFVKQIDEFKRQKRPANRSKER